jgi:molecular chaperone HtpG
MRNTLGPKYVVLRPSLAIFDPAGVCPLNLERSEVAFKKMGFDAKIVRAILKQYSSRVAALAKPCRSMAQFAMFCRRIQRIPGVIYTEGQVAPFAAHKAGVFPVSPKLFVTTATRRLFFVDFLKKPSEVGLATLLRDGEAVILREKHTGRKADLAWVRGILTPVAIDSWYARGIALPYLSSTAAASIISAEKWKLATEKGKVSQRILRELNEAAFDESSRIVTSGDKQDAERLLSRLKEFRENLQVECDVAAWSIAADQPSDVKESTLSKVWSKVVGGPIQRFK